MSITKPIVLEGDEGIQARANAIMPLANSRQRDYGISQAQPWIGDGKDNRPQFLAMLYAYPSTLSDALSSMANMYRKKAEMIANFIEKAASRSLNQKGTGESLMMQMWNSNEQSYQLIVISEQALAQLTDTGKAVVQRVSEINNQIIDDATIIYDDVLNAIADQTSQLRTNEAMFEYFASHDPKSAFNVAELASYAKAYVGQEVDPNSVILQATQGSATVLDAVNNALQARVFDADEYTEGELPKFTDATYTGANAFGMAFTRIWNGITQWFAGIKFDIRKIGEFFDQVFSAIGNALKWIVGKLFPNLTSDYETKDDPVNHILETPIFSFEVDMGTEETNIFTAYTGNKWKNNARMYFPTPGTITGEFHSQWPEMKYARPDGQRYPAGSPLYGPLAHYMHSGSYQWNMMNFIEWAEENVGKVFTCVLPNVTVVYKLAKNGSGGVLFQGQVYLRTNPVNVQNLFCSRYGADPEAKPYFTMPEYDASSSGRYQLWSGFSQKPKPVPSVDNSDNAAIATWIIQNVIGQSVYGDCITQQMSMYPTIPLCDASGNQISAVGGNFSTLVSTNIFDFVDTYSATNNTPADLAAAIKYPASKPYQFSMLDGAAGSNDIKFGPVNTFAQWYVDGSYNTTPDKVNMFYTTSKVTLFAMAILSGVMRTKVQDEYQTRIYFPTQNFGNAGWPGPGGSGSQANAQNYITMDYQAYYLGDIYTPYYEGTPGDYQIHPQTDMERTEEVYSVLKTIGGAVLAVASARTLFKVRKAFRKKKLAKSAQFEQAKRDFAAGNISIDDLYQSQRSAKRWGALSDAVAATFGSEIKSLVENVSPIPGNVTHELNQKAAATADVLTPMLSAQDESLNAIDTGVADLGVAIDEQGEQMLRIEGENALAIAGIAGNIAISGVTLKKLSDQLSEQELPPDEDGNW